MFSAVVLAVFFLGGCNSYNLRYAAIPQPKGANLFADYNLLQDAVTVMVDTDGNRLEDIYVTRGDGAIVRPLAIQHAGYYQSAALGTGIGGFGRHVGGGVGMGFPVGPRRAHGLTTAAFALGDRAADKPGVGQPPWNVHVKVEGIEPAVIPGMGGAKTAK
jgi:hypothetical protein